VDNGTAVKVAQNEKGQMMTHTEATMTESLETKIAEMKGNTHRDGTSGDAEKQDL